VARIQNIHHQIPNFCPSATKSITLSCKRPKIQNQHKLKEKFSEFFALVEKKSHSKEI